MSEMRVGDEIELRIDRMAVGGRGIGRHHNLVVFVENTAPLDLIKVRIIHKKKNFVEAELLKVLEAGPSRRKPPCPVAGKCGGCSWQHIHETEQLLQKREIVAQALKRVGRLQIPEVAPTLPSPDVFRYRNRIQVHVEASGKTGFLQKGSHKLVHIDDCLIADERLIAKFPELQNAAKNQSPNHSSRARVEIELTPSLQVRLRTESREDDEVGFAQVNTKQNENMQQLVVSASHQLLGTRPDSSSHFKIVDLYCGAGNFTFPISDAFPNSDVLGVEWHQASVRTARARALELATSASPAAEYVQPQSQPRKIEFLQGKVEDLLEKLPVDLDLLILDPPRSGCEPAVMHWLNQLSQHRPLAVIYISCHPVTLARDLALLDPARVSILRVQPIDMFPQTDHVETIVTLTLAMNARS